MNLITKEKLFKEKELSTNAIELLNVGKKLNIIKDTNNKSNGIFSFTTIFEFCTIFILVSSTIYFSINIIK